MSVPDTAGNLPAGGPSEPARTAGWARSIDLVLDNPALFMAGILLAMWAVLGQLSRFFFSVDNLFEITIQAAVIAIIAVGQTFVILSGGIDLSVGAVLAATTAVMTPAWAGPEGPAGMAPDSGSSSSPGSGSSGAPMSPASANSGMGDMGTTDGQPDMKMYGSTAPPTAAQVVAAAKLVTQTDASLARYQNVQAAFAAGYTYVLRTNGEEHLLYDGDDPAYAGLNPQDPSSLVYAINVPNHAPILLGAMYIMNDRQNGPQVGGSLTRWHSHLTVCQNGKPTIAGFGVQLRGSCDPSSWQDQYTSQMLHVWVVPYPGGVFSDDLSLAATNAAVAAALNTAPAEQQIGA